jgi:tetratricopeptide (TPR) repeat protein
MAVCFSLATVLQPRAATWSRGAQSGSVLKVLLGDGRRLFADQFFEQADVSFHSGYYPSIFDLREKPKDSPMAGGNAEHDEAEHERQMAMGQPHDWIEAFGRHFRVTEHTHLEQGQEREILPWLRLSAELNPQRVETYTVAAYWLRSKLGKTKEAEEFLREGLRANQDSYEILFELGRLYYESHHDARLARNLWELALRKWEQGESKKKEPDLYALDKIAANLGQLEEQEGNLGRAIERFELAKRASPHPESLQKRIDELKQKLPSQVQPPGQAQ